MGSLIGLICEIVAVLATVMGFGYAFISLWGAATFLWQSKINAQSSAASFTPAASILKPLKGTDRDMYESFRSHCLQEYPDYEIIFGVSNADDPAVRFVEKLKAEFPRREIRLVVCRENLGPNAKVSNLAQMARSARHEILLMNDSDIRVEPNYLRRVIGPLEDPRTGLVTCLYRGVPGLTLGSKLEALGITDFAAGVFAAQQLERGINFGLGSTLAFRRHDLQALGGFEAFTDYLADDYQIGAKLVNQGLRGTLSSAVVETHLPAYDFSEFIRHQLRWARTVRDSRPFGYAGLGATYYLPWACVAVACSGGRSWVWMLLIAAIVLRATSILVIGRLVLNDCRTTSQLVLTPLRDLIALVVWVVGFFGNRVDWRGESFILRKGKLTRLGLKPPQPLQ